MIRLLIAALATATFSLGFVAGSSAQKPPITIEDVHNIADLSEPVFSPDGERIAYTVANHNLKIDATTSDIWVVDWETGTPRNLTNTPDISEWSPRYARDSGVLAWLSDNNPHGETQVQLVSENGVPFQASDIVGGVSEFDISPDGRKLIVVAEVGKRVKRGDAKAPIVIDRYFFKEDGRGWIDDRRSHLFLIDIESGSVEQLTHGPTDHWSPSWSPLGDQFAFVSKIRGDTDRNLDTDVFVMPAKRGGKAVRIGRFNGADAEPTWEARPEWSPDGSKLVWLQAFADRWIYYAPIQLAVADLKKGKVTLPARIDRWFYKPRWSADGSRILALIEQDRDTWLAEIDPETDAIRYLTEGQRFALDFSVSTSGRIAVLDGDAQTPYELRAIGADSRTLTRHNDWLHSRKLHPYRDITFKSDGEDIHGILVLPESDEKSGAPPVIIRLHGGPVYQFSHEFMHDWQVFAAKGYAVLGVNPRGSSGRGFDFARVIFADWGDKDADDITAAIDYLERQRLADPDRVGIGGWSYGGILANYVIASDRRIKAAVSGAGMANFYAGYGADQYAREYEFELGAPWKNRRAYDRVSYPFLNAHRIQTPTLFMCAEEDQNVPCIGSEQMYQALKSNGIEARLVIYPDETHTISSPSFIRDRLERQLDWYDRHLKAPQ